MVGAIDETWKGGCYAEIVGCANRGDIQGLYAGGMVGYVPHYNNAKMAGTTIIKSCMNTGTLTTLTDGIPPGQAISMLTSATAYPVVTIEGGLYPTNALIGAYVIGFTEFCGLRFRTDSRALIPRPETEELVAAVVDENASLSGLKVLDIGTGTGAIAVSLAVRLDHAAATACDISADALALAAENARLNNVQVRFEQCDILQCENLSESYDIIISNPPYIPENIRNTLHRNVIDYEPGIALFVPDNQPLLFYDKIASLAAQSLLPKGKLYFETYEEYHPQLVELMMGKGFAEVESRKDFYGRPRFVRATR